MKESFINSRFKGSFLTDQFNRTPDVSRKALTINQRIPPTLKFNITLPNIRKFIDKHWHLLQINPKLKNAFQKSPRIAYILGSHKILNNKVIRKKKTEKNHLFSSPCYTIHNNLSCQQVEKTNVFKSYKTGKTQNILPDNK